MEDNIYQEDKNISQNTAETRKKVVRKYIQDGRTPACSGAKYGVSTAMISNWVRTYREECQTNDAAMLKLELTQEVYRFRQEKTELKENNLFLKKQRHFLRRKAISSLLVC